MSKKKIKSKMTYSESELDSNFAINSVSDFDSASESDYESDSESDSSLESGHLSFLYSIFAFL